MYLIRTTREWRVMHSLVQDKFYSVSTDEQKTDFVEFCNKKFHRPYTVATDTADGIQTDIYLMLDFAYNNGISL